MGAFQADAKYQLGGRSMHRMFVSSTWGRFLQYLSRTGPCPCPHLLHQTPPLLPP
eukprot:NODE_4118_length_331_cov_158.070922_g4036_i0.p3 GENE.NODE_4118_length_331_cov_158.070922_g4036_i0~~NODE_4118_length_331_cov_158.070922_g4036_i0.p3  ORF type:complete len:55 (-),score=5.97 NODE_4118_length_331_cov_158.070922_g4036_i0:62-226(-)